MFAVLHMGVAVGLASDIPKTQKIVQRSGDMNAKAAEFAAHAIEGVKVPVGNVKDCRCPGHGRTA